MSDLTAGLNQVGDWPVVATPVEGNPFKPDQVLSGVYDDTPTAQEITRQSDDMEETAHAQNNPTAVVIPPEMETQDRLPMRVVNPAISQENAFHPDRGMRSTYGAGKFKIYSPNAPQTPSAQSANAIEQMIAKLNQNAKSNDLMNSIFGGAR
jgi:hypothetical protein